MSGTTCKASITSQKTKNLAILILYLTISVEKRPLSGSFCSEYTAEGLEQDHSMIAWHMSNNYMQTTDALYSLHLM